MVGAASVVTVTPTYAATIPSQAIPSQSIGNQTISDQAAAKPAVPKLSWSPCLTVYQCATAKVPLDYDEPNGKTIQLKLIRKPAGDQTRRIGSLFVNPGGPGAAIVDMVTFTAITTALGHDVGSRFDIVGIDPRGVGGSTPVSCPSAPGIPPVAAPKDTYPSEGQYDAWFARDEFLAKTCAKTGGEVFDHMSTADNARDLDLLRQAVGDQKLNYYGLSYGSLLGSTYASMFPTKVRALAMDGVLDPVAWTTGKQPPFIRIGSHRTMSETLISALKRCDQGNIVQCPLTGNALGRWQRVRRSLTEKPLTIAGQTLTGKSFVDQTHQAFQLDHMMGLPAPTIPIWLASVKVIDILRFPATAPAPGGAGAKTNVSGVAVDFSAPHNVQVRQLSTLLRKLSAAGEQAKPEAESDDVTAGMAKTHGVWCQDVEVPRDRRTWIDAGKASDVDGLGIGPTETWGPSVCAKWTRPAEDAYRGPFGGRLATAPLTISLAHDSVTGIKGARSAAARFPGSRVVEVDSWGHTALGRSRQCLKPAIDTYFLKQKLPAKNLSCKPDEGLYGLTP